MKQLDAQRVEELTAWVRANPERAAAELETRRLMAADAVPPAPEPEPKQLGELLRTGWYLITINGEVVARQNINLELQVLSGTTFCNPAAARRVAKQRIKRQQLEAWVEQERQQGEVADASIYNDRGVWGLRPDVIPMDLGAVLMPERLAKLLCDKLNSGEWVL